MRVPGRFTASRFDSAPRISARWNATRRPSRGSPSSLIRRADDAFRTGRDSRSLRDISSLSVQPAFSRLVARCVHADGTVRQSEMHRPQVKPGVRWGPRDETGLRRPRATKDAADRVDPPHSRKADLLCHGDLAEFSRCRLRRPLFGQRRRPKPPSRVRARDYPLSVSCLS